MIVAPPGPPRKRRCGPARRVTVTRTPGGEYINWLDVVGDIMKIRCSSRRPPNAAVAVDHHGKWFYIADDDLNAKSTFSLLSQLFSLQAGEIKSTAPFLMMNATGD